MNFLPPRIPNTVEHDGLIVLIERDMVHMGDSYDSNRWRLSAPYNTKVRMSDEMYMRSDETLFRDFFEEAAANFVRELRGTVIKSITDKPLSFTYKGQKVAVSNEIPEDTILVPPSFATTLAMHREDIAFYSSAPPRGEMIPCPDYEEED